MITHYIYEIVGKKIGCTKNIEQRMKAYPPSTPYIIRQVLEDITDAEASETELVWQCRLGYPRDDAKYEQTIAWRQAGRKASTTEEANKKRSKTLIDGMTPERREAMSKAMSGVPKSEEHKRALSKAKTGVSQGPLSEEHKQKISKAKTGVPLSETHKQAMFKARIGVPLSETHKQALSKAHQGVPLGPYKPQKIITCPHCSRSGSQGNMKRYHFERCSNNPVIHK